MDMQILKNQIDSALAIVAAYEATDIGSDPQNHIFEYEHLDFVDHTLESVFSKDMRHSFNLTGEIDGAERTDTFYQNESFCLHVTEKSFGGHEDKPNQWCFDFFDVNDWDQRTQHVKDLHAASATEALISITRTSNKLCAKAIYDAVKRVNEGNAVTSSLDLIIAQLSTYRYESAS